MPTAALYSTPTRRVTYLGVPAEVRTIARSKNATRIGERVYVMHWLGKAVGQPVEYEAGTTVAQHIKGDGRRRDFVKYDEQIVTDADAYAAHRLAS